MPPFRLGWIAASVGEALAVGAVVFLIVGAAVYGLWQEAEQSALQNKRTELMRLASSLSSLVDGDVYDKFRESSQTNTKEFEVAVAPLRKAFHATPGIKFLYTTRLEDGKIKFVIDATKPGDQDGDGREDQSQVGEVYENTDPSLAIALQSAAKPVATASDKPYTDEWGTFISGFAPYFRKDGTLAGVLGVDIDAKDFVAEQARRRNQATSGLIPATGLAIMVVVISFVARLSFRRVKFQAMEELRRNIRLAEIARRTEDAVIVVGLDRKVEWVNEGFVRMTGFMLAHVQGKTVAEAMSGPETVKTEIARIGLAMDRILRAEATIRYYRQDCTAFWAELEVEPVFDSTGKHAGFMTIVRDVTDALAAKENLESSERQLQAIFGSMAEGVIMWAEDGTVASANAAAEHILGIARRKLVGSKIENRIYSWTDKKGNHLSAEEDPASVSLRTGMPVHGFLAGFTRPDRTHGWLRVNTELMHDAEGACQGVVVSFADATEVEEAATVLADERARLTSFVTHAPAAIAMLDSNFTYVAASGRWEELLGLDIGSSHGLNHFDTVVDSPPSWSNAFHECLTGQVVTCEDEIWIQKSTGERRHLWWESRPWHMSDGAIGGVLVSATDITTQVERETSIRELANELLDMNQRLDSLATRDPLTNLFNRRRFLQLLEETVKSATEQTPPGLLYLDLDNFKYVNDAMGHDAGDQLLRTVADRLVIAAAGASIARLGGDEFAVLLHATNQESAEKVAEDIVKFVQEPVHLDGRQISTSFSVGVTVSKGSASVDTLLQQADMAMYYAKSEGKSCWRIYDQWMSEATVNRLQLEADMRRAWEKREFEVYYQPLVEAATGNKVSAEALIRWKSRRRGVVGPDKFIPLLEEIGLIDQVGLWVLEQACRSTQSLRETTSPELRVAVNVSGVQLKNPDFVDLVKGVLDSTGLPPSALTLEITETVLVAGLESYRAMFDALRAMGIKLAVDDFGTGYSAMGLLASLPVDIVKIDKSFVNSVGECIEAGAIIRALVTLCKVIGLTVVAEGIETESQFVQLHALGTDHCQGYFFSGPLDEEKYRRWITGSARAA